MRPWPIVLFIAACSSTPAPAPAPDSPATTATGERREACLIAQELEVQAWLNHAVTAGDETETWATLGMVMTPTEPEVIAEMRDVSPEASAALDSSAETWEACHGVIAVNCASLDQAAELTEERIGSEVWDSTELIERCADNRVSAAQADCVLAARDDTIARGCLEASMALKP